MFTKVFLRWLVGVRTVNPGVAPSIVAQCLLITPNTIGARGLFKDDNVLKFFRGSIFKKKCQEEDYRTTIRTSRIENYGLRYHSYHKIFIRGIITIDVIII